jgi:AGZA family xanthine/uracil permease-like MFS transporter
MAGGGEHTAVGYALRTEILAGVTTFLTMSYIIFVQPAVLSGRMTGGDTGMAAALATAIMGWYAKYPIALAPGMGQNFFFVLTAIPVAASAGAAVPWHAALGAVFLAGIAFLLISLMGIRERIIDAVSPDMKIGIAVGIGLFIALIGLRNGQVVLTDPGTGVRMNPRMVSPDVLVFLFGFLAAAMLQARRVRGAVLYGILTSLSVALLMRGAIALLSMSEAAFVSESLLVGQFELATGVVSLPPALSPTLFKLDLVHAVSASMLPIVVMFLFMDVFDTMGTLIGVGERAGLLQDGKLVRGERAMLADAVGTVAGAAMGTSTVTSYIESAAGVEQGGRTGCTALTVAALFLLALFFYPVIAMVGSYPPITAPALVLVGSMMAANVARIRWADATEAIPAFLTIIGIPFFSSIADGIALGLITYPVIKAASGRGRDVAGSMWVVAGILVLYFVFVRSQI